MCCLYLLQIFQPLSRRYIMQLLVWMSARRVCYKLVDIHVLLLVSITAILLQVTCTSALQKQYREITWQSQLNIFQRHYWDNFAQQFYETSLYRCRGCIVIQVLITLERHQCQEELSCLVCNSYTIQNVHEVNAVYRQILFLGNSENY